jgi:hypothetical protein
MLALCGFQVISSALAAPVTRATVLHLSGIGLPRDFIS